MSDNVNADIEKAIRDASFLNYLQESRKIIFVKSLKHTKGLEGNWVICSKYKWPIYIPKRDKNGIPILPADWRDDDEDN